MYRKKYENPRLDEVYRLYVDGQGSLRKLVKLSKLSLKTLDRRSKKDAWVAERDERSRQRAHDVAQAVTVSAEMAAMATGGDIQSKLSSQASAPDARSLIQRVLGDDQQFWDQLAVDVKLAYADQKKKYAERKQALSVPLIGVFAKNYQLIADGRRDAYGIPKVTKLEIEDKSGARLHADAIQKRRQSRLAAAVVSADQDGVGQHRPM